MRRRLLWHRGLSGSSGGGEPAPALSIDFTGGTLPGAVTFSRASAGLRYNASGVVTSDTNNVARFDYDPGTLALKGMLIEGARTNTFYPSTDYSTYPSQNSLITVSVNSTVAPDGASSADTLIPTGHVSYHRYYSELSSTTGTSSHSVFLKPAGYTEVALRESKSTGAAVVFTLTGSGTIKGTHSTGGVTASGTIQALPNGWYKITAVFAGAASQWFGIYILNGTWTSGDPEGHAWSGNGTSGIYAWGSQLELGNPASSHIPTVGVPVARAADIATFNIPSGVSTIRYTFDDLSTQDVAVTGGTLNYPIPTNLNRPWIRTIVSV